MDFFSDASLEPPAGAVYNADLLTVYDVLIIPRASKSPDFSGDLPIFDNIMKISRSPDSE